MVNICLITLNGNENYGNKLQHLAIQKYIKKYNISIKTLRFLYYSKIIYKLKHLYKLATRSRYRKFIVFDKKIEYYDSIFYKYKKNIKKNIEKKFDFFLVGSDQVWNYSIKTYDDLYLLSFIKDNYKKISISASFGVGKMDEKHKEVFKNNLKKFKAISVRENSGKRIVEELTGRKDIEVLVDPTMLLDAEDWDKVSKKPKQLKTDKYILNYFLGNLSEKRKREIERVAKENDCEIINIMDKNDPLYVSGPSEFLWLEKHAFLICTDSFHSSVFALLYNRPFIVFDREQEGIESMNSRIDTLIKKFNLKNRRFTGKITEENLEHDYTEAYEILEKERAKSRKFIEKALDIENKE